MRILLVIISVLILSVSFPRYGFAGSVAEAREFIRELSSSVAQIQAHPALAAHKDLPASPGVVTESECQSADLVSRLPTGTLSGVLDRFHMLTKNLRPVSGAAGSMAGDAWPVAECPLPLAGSANWMTLRDETISVLSGELLMIAGEFLCYTPGSQPTVLVPEIRGVKSEHLRLEGTCEGGGEDAGYLRGKIHVRHQGVVHWASVANNPDPCAALGAALSVLTQLKELQEMWLSCQTDSYITASYDRLEYLRGELAELSTELDFLIRFQTETNLQIWSGSRIADLYLPENLGGHLERIADIAHTSASETAAVGYIVGAEVRRSLDAADRLSADNEIKKAFDHYRHAYREATVGSRRLQRGRAAP
jgi:hypothetical protein